MAGLNRKWRRQRRDTSLHRDRDHKPVKHWEEQEEIGAEAHGARRTRGSGGTWKPDEKLDSVGDIFRMSNKTTGHAKSIRFEREWLEEAKRAAGATNHQPAVMFGFDPDAQDRREDWVAVPAAAFHYMAAIALLLEDGDVKEAREMVRVLRRTQ
jgi:hypothetical protein